MQTKEILPRHLDEVGVLRLALNDSGRRDALPETYDYASEVMVGNMLAYHAEQGIGPSIAKRAP